jgi:hypothetical protein
MQSTLNYIGTDALHMIEAARACVLNSDTHEEVCFVAEQLNIEVSRNMPLEHAKLIVFANLVVMEKNTITFFRLG